MMEGRRAQKAALRPWALLHHAPGLLTVLHPPPACAQVKNDKSHLALQRRAEVLRLLISSPRIDPRAVNARGRAFLFDCVGWALCQSTSCRDLLRSTAQQAGARGVSVNHQASRR